MSNARPGYWVEDGILWYASDSSGQFHSKHRIEDADIRTLTIFDQTWAKDAKRVWARGERVTKVYAPAFKALNASFGRDNECVFECSGGIIKGMNAAAFEVLDDGLLHDDRRDPANAGYARCEGKIYHYAWGDHKTTQLRGADGDTFEALKWGFARDKTKVFWGVNVAKANPQTFRHITCRFGEDGRKVFYYTRVVPEADPATFQFLGDQFWARDKSHVYYQDRIVPGPDPGTSRVVGSLLVDASCVYAGSAAKVIAALDAPTLEHIGQWYYRDKSRVFHERAESFVEGADRDTFECLAPKHPSRGDAWDKNWVYRETKRLCPRSEFPQ